MSSSATTADYTSQTKGALKLKGGVPPISKPNRHKKKKKKVDVELEPEPEKEIQREDEEEEEEERGEEREKEERGEEGEKDVMRGKTAAEVRHEERRRKKVSLSFPFFFLFWSLIVF